VTIKPRSAPGRPLLEVAAPGTITNTKRNRDAGSCRATHSTKRKENHIKPINNRTKLFVKLLSHVRHGTERPAAICKELCELAQNLEIQEVLTPRAVVSQQKLGMREKAFKMVAEKPVRVTGPLMMFFVQNFRRELGEIRHDDARRGGDSDVVGGEAWRARSGSLGQRPEFIVRAVQRWLAARGVGPLYTLRAVRGRTATANRSTAGCRRSLRTGNCSDR
jgi:hypothetical protein